MSTENALYTILLEKLKRDALILPTLPEIALKVRKASGDPDVNVTFMSELISKDPSLSLGILKVANSIMYSRSIKADTVIQAVKRIGLRQIKSIATAIAIQQMFTSKNKIISDYMKQSWNNSINIASVAVVLMILFLKRNKHADLSVDVVVLASLTHNIGVLPILAELENHPFIFSDLHFIDNVVSQFSNKIGEAITKHWGFSCELVSVIADWNNLQSISADIGYIDFIRAGAIYHKILCQKLSYDMLITSFVEKGIIPNEAYFYSEEFNKLVMQTKQMLS